MNDNRLPSVNTILYYIYMPRIQKKTQKKGFWSHLLDLILDRQNFYIFLLYILDAYRSSLSTFIRIQKVHISSFIKF